MKWIGAISLVVVLLLAFGGAWYSHIQMKPEPEAAKQQVVVCIDPGHPSETNSARRRVNGTNELTINWEVAQKLEAALKEDKRIQVVMTRHSLDEFVRNHDRAYIANRADASLAIHIHCDAGPSHGFTVYYPDHVGKAEGKVGPSRKVLVSSRKAAYAVHKGMADTLEEELQDRGVKGESFTRIGRANGALTTSIRSKVPTLTVEMVFLNNRSDADFIKSEQGQEQMVEALANGIKNYLRPQLNRLANR